MPPSSFPFSRSHPAFEEKQPVAGPRDDRLRDEFVRGPDSLLRIVQAKAGILWIGLVEIDVWWQFAGLSRVQADHGIDDLDRSVGVRKSPAIEETAAEVGDANAIASHDRSHRAFPHPNPAGIQRQLKIWKDRANAAVLLLDAEPAHSCSSPKNLWGGVARAAAGTNPVMTPAAGICPVRGRKTPLPRFICDP